MWPTHPLVQWALGIKQPGRESTQLHLMQGAELVNFHTALAEGQLYTNN
jgi:hypothetical protein